MDLAKLNDRDRTEAESLTRTMTGELETVFWGIANEQLNTWSDQILEGIFERGEAKTTWLTKRRATSSKKTFEENVYTHAAKPCSLPTSQRGHAVSILQRARACHAASVQTEVEKEFDYFYAALPDGLLTRGKCTRIG